MRLLVNSGNYSTNLKSSNEEGKDKYSLEIRMKNSSLGKSEDSKYR